MQLDLITVAASEDGCIDYCFVWLFHFFKRRQSSKWSFACTHSCKRISWSAHVFSYGWRWSRLITEQTRSAHLYPQSKHSWINNTCIMYCTHVSTSPVIPPCPSICLLVCHHVQFRGQPTLPGSLTMTAITHQLLSRTLDKPFSLDQRDARRLVARA